VRIGSITIGAGHPIAAQSMTATHTTDVAATLAQANALHAAGAGVVRIAVDSKSDAAALPAGTLRVAAAETEEAAAAAESPLRRALAAVSRSGADGSSGAERIEENEAKEGAEERADAPQAATTRQKQQRLYGYYAC
jgi:hypothetical protein